MKNLFKSLAEFQHECPTIKKEKNNEFGKFKYTDLADVVDVIRPLLPKHGLGYFQWMKDEKLITTVFHIESGEKIESEKLMPSGVQLKGMNEFQVMGSAISYMRKYQLCAILGVVSDEKSIDSVPNERQKLPIKDERFESGVSQVKKGELSKAEFINALSKFELSESQKNVISLL